MGDIADKPQEGHDDGSKLSPFEQQIADAKAAEGVPESVKSLLDNLFGEVKNTRKEAAGKRTKVQTLEAELNQLKNEAAKNKNAGLSDSEKTQQAIQALQTELAAERSKREASDARAAFVGAEVVDIDTVELYWQALKPDERAATTPVEFAKTLKEKKPHLFKAAEPKKPSGPNPLRDGGAGGKKPEPVITHPKTQAEARQVLDRIRGDYKRQA